MQTLQLRLPDFVDIDAQELSLILASRLYEQGKLSIGQAAELAGLPKRAFMELLGRANVSAFNYDADELERDMRNA
jgi:predicted HTH domain antitoxin